ncbi:MAG: Alkaline phosphatase precursor [Firmicutes bacterium ADurb.Bin262]|nr:MAG: Alkaline phosphatase precursor [Firmicutes bacterium ADurb.Bin262]
MFHKRSFFKTAAAALAMVLVLACVQPAADAAVSVPRAPLQAAVLSDIHYYPQSLMGDKGDAWRQYCENNARQDAQCEALLGAALDAVEQHARTNGCKYIFIPGDLTKDSEYAGHAELAGKLEDFERRSGIQVLVINGNHDINNSGATTFENNRPEKTLATSPEEFKQIYANLGYDLACSTYTPPPGKKAGMLSYAARLEGGYRLIVIDACKYSSDSTPHGLNEHKTGGNITPELMDWILRQSAEAAACGETVIGMAHHSLVPQFEIEPSVFQDFVVDNWLETTETLADAGMRYVFTGHMHTSNIASHVTDRGETITDCSTASLTGFPNTFREVLFEPAGKGVSAQFNTFDVDCVTQIQADGKVYEKPYRNTFSFGQTYGKTGLPDFAVDMAETYLSDIFDDIREGGGLLAYLQQKGIDLESILANALGKGLAVGKTDLFTSRNIMSFAGDLAAQIDEVYINDPARVLGVIRRIADGLMSMPVSDLPCTKFIETLGFGDPAKPGTLQDASYSILATLYPGDEDIGDDLFLHDVLARFADGSNAKALYDRLVDVVIDDLLLSEILASLKFNPGSLFPPDTALHIVGVMLTALIDVIFRGDNSFTNIIESTLSVLPAQYDSVEGILGYFTGEYLTSSQFDAWGATISQMLGCLVTDTNPGFKQDSVVVLTYSGSVEVIPTVADYRLPSNVAVTFGNDARSTRNITWLTKYSVTGSDIELIPFGEAPVFRGIPTRNAGIISSSERVTRSYPGADLGIAGFLEYAFPLVRHEIRLTGLKPGSKYFYRIGDAAKGWWSPAGVIETAGDSDRFAFLHMTDPQAQNEAQYRVWADVVDTAFKQYPQAKFILSSGDLVDNAANVRQYGWLFNTAAENLRSTALMTTAGNHEEKGFALDENFLLPDAPAQDRSSGVYYSFDYQNAHFIVLNTNDLSEDGALSDGQLAWLKADTAASGAQWKIVSLHKAMYSNGSHYDDSDVKALRKQLASLMPQLGIDLVLQGHDHVYLRTGVMSGNKVVISETRQLAFDGRNYQAKIEPEGTVYAISACAGVKYYPPKSALMTRLQFPKAERTAAVELPVFSAVQIEGSTLYFDAYTVDNGKTARIDSFALQKAAAPTAETETPAGAEQGGSPAPQHNTQNTVVTQKASKSVPVSSDITLRSGVPQACGVSPAQQSQPAGETDTVFDEAIPLTGSNEANGALYLLCFAGLAALAALRAKRTKKEYNN